MVWTLKPGTELLASASDDGFIHVWEGGDDGEKQAVATFEVGCPITSVAWSADGTNLYAGALDNEIHVRHPCLSLKTIYLQELSFF